MTRGGGGESVWRLELVARGGDERWCEMVEA